MKMKFLAGLLLSGCFALGIAQKISVSEAVDYNVNSYPEAQLADLYKSFYQDAFGPGHILADTVASRNYFNRELSDTTQWRGPVWEYTGAGKNFVRLNMDLIKKGVIPAEEYFRAFATSLGRVTPPSPEVWIGEWLMVDSVVNAKGYSFPNEDSDRKLIEEKLKTHNFTMHHSAGYDSLYNFHYRIISLPEFEKLKEKYNF